VAALHIARTRNRRLLALIVLVISGFSWILFAIKHTGTFLFPALLWLVVALIALFAPEHPTAHEDTDRAGRP
jgi:hypothetical protein